MKILSIASALILGALAFAIYYGNYLAPNLKPISKEAMNNYLVQTKSEVWLQKRIENGERIYEAKIKAKRQEWIDKNNNTKKIYSLCREGSEAYRMKNAYECNRAWSDLGGIGDFGYLLFQESNMPDFSLNFNRNEIIQMSILGDCVQFQTIGNAKKNGCYYQ